MREFIKTLVYAILIAVAFRTVAYEPFNIPSGSMFPTLLVGDYLFVSKPSYGYSRHSLPFSPPLFDGRILASAPERGDVAVFKKPSDEATDYIKRVIGLPGDRIQMKQGRLYINGEIVPRRRVEDYVMTDHYGRTMSIPQYIETLPNGVEHHILEQLGDRAQHDNTREFEIPDGLYFMMGDNRDNSLDSRDGSVGMVPFENFVGRAEFLFFSTDGSARGYEFWKWPFATRYSRLFQAIE
jgi:signal peptidase I